MEEDLPGEWRMKFDMVLVVFAMVDLFTFFLVLAAFPALSPCQTSLSLSLSLSLRTLQQSTTKNQK